MIKKFCIIAILALLLLPAGVMAAGYQGGYGGGGGGSGTGTGQTVSLTEEEQQWLTFMREEEKLARDTYLFLYAKWKMPIFSNIASSEQKHMDALKVLLDRYGIPDPASQKQGEFSVESGLQPLYDKLVAQGSLSRVEALNVGVIIEVKDIADLDDAIASTQHNDIRLVYGNLRQGSYNHLDAFNSQLSRY
jgi:hypothetical protein